VGIMGCLDNVRSCCYYSMRMKAVRSDKAEKDTLRGRIRMICVDFFGRFPSSIHAVGGLCSATMLTNYYVTVSTVCINLLVII